ncbi:MAG: hypothetical protein ACO3UU_02585 [Minisyncoccia bacterium]
MSKKIYKKVIDKVNKMTEKEIKESILAANPQLKKDINLVKLTDTHLSIINTALEAYYRLKSGQVSMALDIAYEYKLTYDQSHAIESIVKVMALPELAKKGCNYGFNSPEIGDGKIAFEIRKTFEEVLAVKRNGGYYGDTVDFHGPLKSSDEPLPEVVNFVNYIDHKFTDKQSDIINDYYHLKDFEKMWEYADSITAKLPKGEKREIIPSFNGVVMRIHKPRKPSNSI